MTDNVINECSICLEPCKKGRYRLRCKHVFHKKCIRTWTLEYKKDTCPICRDVIQIPKNKNRCHRCFHTYCKRSYKCPHLAILNGSVMCNSLGYCCGCNKI